MKPGTPKARPFHFPTAGFRDVLADRAARARDSFKRVATGVRLHRS